MQKLTIYFITLIIICVAVLFFAGEYFTYRYALFTSQQTSQQQTTASSSTDQNSNNTNQQNSGSSDALITSFIFTNPMAVGTIYGSNHTIVITVPPITDITKLTPTIETSPNTTISPSSGTAQDFTNPVVYKVAAQNGESQSYSVTVKIASILKSVGKSITSFKFLGLNPEVDGFVENGNHTINAVVPDGTDLTKLVPSITVSDGATISPSSGTAQDFTNPVKYTVTDMYGGQQDYTITIISESSSG